MSKCQCKNTINKIKGNMAPQKTGYPRTVRPEQPNTSKAQENNLKTNFVKIIEVLKEEMKKKLRKRWECGAGGTLFHCWWDCKLTLWKAIWQFLRKLGLDLHQDTEYHL